MQPFALSAGRLRLRPVEESDAAAVLDGCQDPEVLRWTVALPDPYTADDATAFVRRLVPDGWANDTEYTWAVTEPVLGSELLGVLGLKQPLGGRPEIGYWLAPRGRGRGLMADAASLACRCAFDRLGAEAVLWQALAGNEPSRRVAERVGFRIGEPVRRGLEQRGRWHDSWLGTLLPDDPPAVEEPELTDGVVTLRRWQASDLPHLAAIVDDEVLRWTTFPGRDDEQMRAWLDVSRRLRRPPEARYAITGAGEAPVGSLRLSREPLTGAVGVGWWMGPQARGRGYTRRALQLALPWAARAGAPRFVADIYPGNDASIALAESIGMTAEALRRGCWPGATPGGPRRDTWLYSLVPGDAGWPAEARSGSTGEGPAGGS